MSESLSRRSERAVEGEAGCRDCPWADALPGFRQRAGRHHRRTGHQVVTTATTTYCRVVNDDPNQFTIDDFLGERAA